MCKDLGDELRVIVNNDKQVIDKTGKQEVFQDQDFRMRIVSALKVVDQVVLSVDQDGSVCESIKHIAQLIQDKY
jgi:glycerol-3-phosphate cytidylyltransferase-like family protein